jgi:branched-subunit amino acid transport protein AzlD
MVIVAAGVRLMFLGLPMRYDEALTYNGYACGQYTAQFLAYTAPNNHVFHTILVRGSILLLGNAPEVIRLPALLAGLLCIPAVFLCSRVVFGTSGWVAAALTAVFPYLVLYSVNARGYSLIVLFTALAATCALGVLRKPGGGSVLLLAGVSALGMWTIPTMMFPVAGIAVWLAAELLMGTTGLTGVKRLVEAIRWPVLYVMLTVLLAALLYAPVMVVSGLGSLVDNRFVKALPFAVFANQAPAHIMETAARFFRDVPPALTWTLVVMAILGVGGQIRKGSRGFRLVLALLIGGGVVWIAKRAIPFDRTWIYLLPFFLMLVEAGGELAAEWIGGPRSRKLIIGLALGVAVVAGGGLTAAREAVGARDVNVSRNAPAVAKFLHESGAWKGKVLVRGNAEEPLRYYLVRCGLPPGTVVNEGQDVGYVVAENRERCQEALAFVGIPSARVSVVKPGGDLTVYRIE